VITTPHRGRRVVNYAVIAGRQKAKNYSKKFFGRGKGDVGPILVRK